MNKPLTYDELMALALKHYSKGGDNFYECWNEKTFDEYTREFGPMTKEKALEMFRLNLAIWNEYQATVW